MNTRSYKKKRARSKRSFTHISPMTIRSDGSSQYQFAPEPTLFNKAAKEGGDFFGEFGRYYKDRTVDYGLGLAKEYSKAAMSKAATVAADALIGPFWGSGMNPDLAQQLQYAQYA